MFHAWLTVGFRRPVQSTFCFKSPPTVRGRKVTKRRKLFEDIAVERESGRASSSFRSELSKFLLCLLTRKQARKGDWKGPVWGWKTFFFSDANPQFPASQIKGTRLKKKVLWEPCWIKGYEVEPTQKVWTVSGARTSLTWAGFSTQDVLGEL